MNSEDAISQSQSEAWLDSGPLVASAVRILRDGESAVVIDYGRFYSLANLGVMLLLAACFLAFIWIGWFLLVWNNLGPTSSITLIATLATALLIGVMVAVVLTCERKRRRNSTVPPVLKIRRENQSLVADAGAISSYSFRRLIIVIGRASGQPTTSVWSFSQENRYLQLLLDSEGGIQHAATVVLPRDKQVEALVTACQVARVPHAVQYVTIANRLTEKLVNRAFNTTKIYR